MSGFFFRLHSPSSTYLGRVRFPANAVHHLKCGGHAAIWGSIHSYHGRVWATIERTRRDVGRTRKQRERETREERETKMRKIREEKKGEKEKNN